LSDPTAVLECAAETRWRISAATNNSVNLRAAVLLPTPFGIFI